MNRRAGALLAASVPALLLPAQPAAANHVATSASVQLVSDYRYRGISLSDAQPALQGWVEGERSGWFASAWANLTLGGDTGDEVDFAIGRRGRVAGLDACLTAQAHLYSDSGDPRSVELLADAGRQVGAARVDVELAFAPRRLGNQSDNVYLGGDVAVPIPATPLSARIHGGFEDGFYQGKLDWEAGLSAPLGPATVSASLVGTDGGGGLRASKALLLTIGGSW